MAHKYYLGLDQGTTGSTAILFDDKWQLAARGYQEITQTYPQPGWVEHDPIEIWNSMLVAVQQALDIAHASVSDIACIGIDNEGESIVIWDKTTGIPIYNAIVWQDRRTSRYADQLTEKYDEGLYVYAVVHLNHILCIKLFTILVSAVMQHNMSPRSTFIL